MRLIDADRVKQYALTAIATNTDKEAAAEMIDQLFPTVEAIPVEWIKKWANEHCMYCLDYDYTTEKYDGWYDINSMIKDWEKENE